MIELDICIERNGKMIPAGTITGNSVSDAYFQYDTEYRRSPESAALSISLPLQDEPFSPSRTSRFFDGLLPEGFTRRSVAQWMHVDEGNYLSILHGLGRECLGAIRVTEKGETQDASYEQVSSAHIRELAAEGASKSTDLVIKSHLSLTGASGKVGLYYDPENDRWYLPHGTAASTHIVKQSHIRLDGIVTNEQLSLLTAAQCGISIPHSFIINTGKGAEKEVLFATGRYDRLILKDAPRISGLPCPLRLHQEDFAQAMGISAADKYEQESDMYMQGMFDILRKYSANPIEDQLKLWDLIVFNFLLGNTDAHIKNFSLLYGPDLRSIRLAPAYDLVSTVVYEQSTRNMAFRIAGVCSIDEINAEVFRKAAKNIGLGERIAMKRFSDMCGRFSAALSLSADRLTEEGYENASEMKRRILANGGIRNISV